MIEIAHARAFSGGLALRPYKALSTGTPIVRASPPATLVIAMQQHAGPPAEPIIAPGETVTAGQAIGAARQRGAVAVHTAAGGVVVAVERRLVPSGTRLISSECVVIATRPDDAPKETHGPHVWPDDHAARLAAVRNGGLVGLGGATFPTDIKLGLERPCETLILNGAECEPYISCDDMLMRERARLVIDGATIMLDLLAARRCIVAIERDKQLALKAMQAALDEQTDSRFRLASIPTVYPAGGERQLVESLLETEVPSGALPIDIGVVCQNVGTAYALADLVRHGRPLTTRVVTVTGHGLAEPRNVEAPIGMPIRDLIELCGGLRNDAFQLILGGNMMGYALPCDDVPITKATNCVIALAKAEAYIPAHEWPCIRCAECSTACPARLQPQELLRSVRNDRHTDLIGYGLDECIECGCCDVVCPSHIPLTSIFHDGKRSLARFRLQRQRAAAAEARHAVHLERAAREAAARELEQSQLMSTVTTDDASRRAAIDAAIERAHRRRGPNTDETPS